MISPERSEELLRAYAATRCGTAFRELVTGWTDMVYATALRVSHGQETLAEDTTQSVFTRLAIAPEKVKDARALGAWLHAAATGFTLDALRFEARRRRREETSQRLIMMHSPEPTASDGWHELIPEIDGALSKLPPQDSQLLLLRFWQQQDWRNIGRNFGLSDDAAQKRMNRALKRLRRILARRGITSTTGALCTVLADTIPRDLSAGIIIKIVSTAQVSTATCGASTVLTTIAMNAKSKVAIAATALLLAAAPLIYHRQRIAALHGEIQSLQQRTLTHELKKTPVAVIAEESEYAHSVHPKLSPLPDVPSPEQNSIPSGPIMDFDALNRAQTKEKLAVLRNRLSLTPEQETKIANALEYGQSKIKVSPPNVIVTKATPEDIQKMEDVIRDSLVADQQMEYESFRAEERANALEAVANRELSSLQSMTTLSPEQKDQAFAAFAEIASRESVRPVLDPAIETKAIEEAVKTRWADRLEALSSILTPEQLAIYQQAGNPFTRGFGG